MQEFKTTGSQLDGFSANLVRDRFMRATRGGGDAMNSAIGQGPLARFKVLDLSRVRAGPTAVRQLADWGAQVIKVESPEGDAGMGGERHGPDFQNLHRNKRSMTLNLKSPEGVAILRRLVRDADVLVENYRPDVKFRLGIDYATLRPINPRLVYASISGFGQDGPYRERPGFDQIAQGMGGLMSITGLPGQGPVRVGIPVADLTAGIFCAMGILVALLEREQSGEGQWVQSNLLAAQIAMLDFQAARWLIGHEVPGQAGNDHPTSIPTGVFQTADGYMNIGAAGEAIYRRFCKVIDAPLLASDPDFATNADRSKNRARLHEAISAITRGRTTAAWIDLLNQAGVPCGPIYRMDEVFADPQVRHLNITRQVRHKVLGDVEVVGQAIELSRTPWSVRSASPEPGEHTDDVLRELGYDAAEIAGLRERKVV
jgi:crotonobetainyl-CoA:carnitine CoA-transferase CaiB-like acyl-CoA transferase